MNFYQIASTLLELISISQATVGKHRAVPWVGRKTSALPLNIYTVRDESRAPGTQPVFTWLKETTAKTQCKQTSQGHAVTELGGGETMRDEAFVHSLLITSAFYGQMCFHEAAKLTGQLVFLLCNGWLRVWSLDTWLSWRMSAWIKVKEQKKLVNTPFDFPALSYHLNL